MPTLEQLAAAVAALKQNQPRHGRHGLHGKDGRDGRDGRDFDSASSERAFAHLVEKTIANELRQPLDGKEGAPGPRGATGPRGPEGEKGDKPDHEWDGTQLRFEKPDGEWGEKVDLQGPRGRDGAAGFIGGSGGTGDGPPGTALTLTEAPASNLGYTGTTVSMTYGASLTPTQVVYFDSTGVVLLADANAAGKFPAIGLAMETASSGSHVVLLNGIVRNDAWAWTVGGLVYLSTTAGGLTQTAPSATDDCIQVLGVATHADRMLFAPQLNYVTHV